MPESSRACATWLAVRQTLLDGGTSRQRSQISSDGTWSTSVSVHLCAGQLRPREVPRDWFRARRHIDVHELEPSEGNQVDQCRSSEAFVEAMVAGASAGAVHFEYSGEDLKLLHLTRNFARCFIERRSYQAFLGTDALTEFQAHFQVPEDARLVRSDENTTELTPDGMFFADSVVGLLGDTSASASAAGQPTTTACVLTWGRATRGRPAPGRAVRLRCP